jgi:hypothetical protein
MKNTPARTARIAHVVLTALLVSALNGGVATAPAWAAATQIPTITNDVGQPSDDAGWQLTLGIGLLVAGLLIALVTFAALRVHASRTA